MTVEELLSKTSWKAVTLPDPSREITGGYSGDLLSWVMGRAESGDCWMTIMSNKNVIAVAQLTDVACVVFTEGVMPDGEMIAAADAHDINLICSDDTTFSAGARVAELLK
jgi:DRTGG domain.